MLPYTRISAIRQTGAAIGAMKGTHFKENEMTNTRSTLVDLETRFWQSMVDHDTDAALDLLCEPACMVSAHGAMKFDHAGYRKMADQGSMVVKSFQFNDMEVLFPTDDTAILSYRVKQGVAPRGDGATTVTEMNDTSTWVRTDDGWRCAMHTEAPIAAH
ncbi:MAG: nuclear transport factor 2 family protein [Betaproteobacteria bacterium]